MQARTMEKSLGGVGWLTWWRAAVTITLHLMRHGQGYHSVSAEGHDVRDARLTSHGEAQCLERRESFGDHAKLGLLLSSPLRRALRTCELTFAPCIDRGLRIIALAEAEEASDDPCDTGCPVSELRDEFPKVNFDLVMDRWWVHDGEFATDPASLDARAAKLRRWIRDRPEDEAALVAHGYFNHYLCGNVNQVGEQTTPWWQETELRTFTFEDGHEAMLTETAESLKHRGAATVSNASG